MECPRGGRHAEAVAILERELYLPLVIGDIKLSGAQNGVDLARTVAQHFPASRCILTSAYSLEGFCITGPFIEKPYQPVHVIEVLEEQLAKLAKMH